MVNIFGAILMFTYIEASRPFHDTDSRTQDKNIKPRIKDRTDRQGLINYWVNNAIPIEWMFRAFTMVFNWKVSEQSQKRRERIQKGIELPEPPPADYDRSGNEMEQSQVDQCLDMLKKSFPDIYKDLIRAKDNFFEYLEKKGKENGLTLSQFQIQKHLM